MSNINGNVTPEVDTPSLVATTPWGDNEGREKVPAVSLIEAQKHGKKMNHKVEKLDNVNNLEEYSSYSDNSQIMESSSFGYIGSSLSNVGKRKAPAGKFSALQKLREARMQGKKEIYEVKEEKNVHKTIDKKEVDDLSKS